MAGRCLVSWWYSLNGDKVLISIFAYTWFGPLFSTQYISTQFLICLNDFLGYLNGNLILPDCTTVKFPIFVRLSLITEEFGIFSVEKNLEKERIKQMHPNLLHINMGKKKKDQDLTVS